MYNKQLDTFIKVAECGSFSAAASQMYISASAVIQQINSLESNLSVSLFERSRSGVKLTPEGEYLLQEGKTYIRKGEEIRQELLRIGSRNQTICIGTSMLQKVRLVYELWVLFSTKYPEYNISMINMQTSDAKKNHADLVEGILTNADWQQEWRFMKICDMPLGIGVPRNHPLSAKKKLTYDDLKNETIVSLPAKLATHLNVLVEDMKEHQLKVKEVEEYNLAVFSECAYRNYLIQAPLCWQDVLPDQVMISCEWPHTVPYGLFYQQRPSMAVLEFLNFVRRVYDGSEDVDMVPVF